MKKRKPHTVFLAGRLLSAHQLLGNAYLAEAIHERSHGRLLCRLPQDLDVRGRNPRGIRDMDLTRLLECDAAVFVFDGTEPDSGTVVEFMFAKFADLPAVLVRTDLRHGGDPRHEPRDLMTSRFPRTATVSCASLFDYRGVNLRHRRLEATARLAGQYSAASAQVVCDRVAQQIVRALTRVLRTPPVMPRHLREEVYHWLALMPALRGRPKELRREFERFLEHKIERDLL